MGPFPADTVFPRAMASKMDGVVCMYHDQANIARKLHGFQNSASAVLGLPAPYATTAHGTAYDLVGTGTADPSSLIAALELCYPSSVCCCTSRTQGYGTNRNTSMSITLPRGRRAVPEARCKANRKRAIGSGRGVYST